MCTRILYETGTGTYITARGMDWVDEKLPAQIWVYPRGLDQSGGVGERSIKWKSKYGSVLMQFYDGVIVEGINEKGFVVNILYLSETDYGDPAKSTKPLLSLGAWAQYYIDNFATVDEAVKAARSDEFTIVSPTLPNGKASTGHVSMSDPSGDSAILEYIDGKLTIHHGREYRVMTNSPAYDQQLAINTYWELVGGNRFLPGTINAADRFVRTDYFLNSSPKYEDRDMAVASVISQMRSIGVPLGMADPDHPNISATLWRTVYDQDAMRFYFESAIKPRVLYVDIANFDLTEGAEVKVLDVLGPDTLAGEVSSKFQKAEPMAWIKP